MSKEGVLIRGFRKSDLDEILDLLPRCFAEEFEVSGFDAAHVRDMVNRAFGVGGRLFLASSRVLGMEPFRFLVAEVKGQVVGTTMVNKRGNVGYISTVMVSPDHRRKGIATMLTRSAVEYAQRRHWDKAVLHAVTTNAPALGVYSRLGFEPFEHVAYLVRDAESVPSQEVPAGVEIRPYHGADLNEVYDLDRASEDPSHLRVFGFSRNELKSPLWMRLVRFSSQKRLVAVRANKIVGSVEVEYSTPKEAGHVSSLEVRPEDRSGGIERALAVAAIDEIKRGGVGRIVAHVPTSRPELLKTLNALGFTEAMALVGMLSASR
jgi:ribosomal protein S18 acetylase RimI-like enzyme